MKVSLRSAIALLVAGVAATVVVAAQGHVMQSPAEAAWGPAPPFIPAGAQIAVVSGDPSKPAPYTVRLKFPANYTIAPHSHPTDENVLVLSGAFSMGWGDKLNKTAGTSLAAGGYCLVPAKTNHFAFTTSQETTILLYGQGPVDFKYVNPSDDPRNSKK